MKRIYLTMIIILLLAVGTMIAQQPLHPQTQTKPTFDADKPTVIFYYNGKDKKTVDFIGSMKIDIKKIINLRELDISKDKEAEKKAKSILVLFKDKTRTDLIVVVGKGDESNAIIGSKDVSKHLGGFIKYYARPDLFKKPELVYEKNETVFDKMKALEQQLESMKTIVQDIKEDPIQTIVLIIIIVFFGGQNMPSLLKKLKRKQ